MLMISDAPLINVTEADFPENYVDHQHPEDYTVRSAPISHDFVYIRKHGHSRILLRCAVADGAGKFVSMTFLCNTGAPGNIYLSRKAMSMLTRRIHRADLDVPYMNILGTKHIVSELASPYDNVNILGLGALLRLGLVLSNEFVGITNLHGPL